MLKVLLVDDEKNARDALSQILALYVENAELVDACDSVSSAIQAVKKHRPHVILLDIEVGVQSGFDLFKSFPKPDFKVIFITAHQQYAVQAFRFSALDYLLKPVDPDLLCEALHKADDLIDKENLSTKIDSFLHNTHIKDKAQKKIVLKTADSIHVIALPDIAYCEADRSYTKFFMTDKTRIMVSNTLGDYEELLEEYGFTRIHQSYLVNIDYVKRFEKIDGGRLILKNQISLPVATRKRELLLRLLAQL